jgi:alpha-beta hydrolase superfamily lysophospholipase
MDINLFCFDFIGCGQSEGEYISLGYYEKKQLDIVVKYLYQSKEALCLFLWGRSMGAVTALLYSYKNTDIAGILLDSPFSDLKLLCREIVNNFITIPKFLFTFLFNNIKDKI